MSFRILGTGMYVPSRVVTNDELADMLDTSDKWIRQRVGISERRVCTTETAAELGYQAALQAIENSGCKAEEIDLILAATVSGEDTAPSVSCTIQKLLGVNCVALDINAACSAFLFLLEVAAGYFARGTVKKVLVVGTERMSRVTDWQDRSTCVIFGDGAGAVVLEAGDNYLASTFTVRGGDDIIRIPNPPGNSPFFRREAPPPYTQMKGQETFKFAVNAICSDIPALLDMSGHTLSDIAWIVPHQANARIIDFAAERLNLPKERFFQNIERYGNTSAASIPIALDEMNRGGLLRRGDLLILTAFGGGLAHAACLLRW
jgi:3-oxoacyl-[acyl-carrier-protein] synthase-3